MTFSVDQEGAAGIVVIDGDVTADSEAALEEAFAKAGEHARIVALDFRHLDYMNSGGIGLLVTLLVRARRQRQRLVAFGLDEHYRQIFSLTRLDEAISLYETRGQAVEEALAR